MTAVSCRNNLGWMNCKNEGCERPVFHGKTGQCKTCYRRWYANERRKDPAIRAKANEAAKRYYEKNAPEIIEKQRYAHGDRYLKDPEYRELVKQRARERHHARKHNSEYRAWRRDYRRKKYTLHSPEYYAERLREQDGKCALCTRIMSADGQGPDSPCADHCHDSLVPRAVLCWICNTVLGSYEKHQRPAGLRLDGYEAYLAKWRKD